MIHKINIQLNVEGFKSSEEAQKEIDDFIQQLDMTMSYQVEVIEESNK